MELPDFEPDVDLGAATNLPPFLASGMQWKDVDPSEPLEDWDTPIPQSARTDERRYEDAFPPEIAQELQGLMFLGHLDRRVELLGHVFVMRTLKAGEELACTLVVKEFEESLGQAKALAMAFVGASLVSVDGKKMVQPLGPDQTLSVIRQRFEYVRDNWFWPVISMLYTEYSQLTIKQAEVYEALAGNSNASRHTA